MGRIDSADYARVGRFIAETAELPAGDEPFSRAFLAALRRLVPCDFVGYAENDRVRCRVLAFVEDPIYDGPEPELRLRDIGCDDPLHRYVHEAPTLRVAHRLSDFAGMRDLRRSRCYTEWFGTYGTVHHLQVGLDAPQWHAKVFCFDRGQGSDFTERDLAVLDVLRPYLAARRAFWQVAPRGVSTAWPPTTGATLTVREREVLNLLADGLTNGEIAQRLWVSPGTVRRHLENIYEKLDVHTRTAAVRAAARLV
jgi:DNA-binding CsgD family transcriptional regulator